MKLSMRLTRKQVAALTIAMVLLGLVLFALPFLGPGAQSTQSKPLHASWKSVNLSGVVPPSVHLSQVQLADSTTAWLVGRQYVEPGPTIEGHVYKLKWEQGKWNLSEQYIFPYSIQYLHAAPDGTVRVVGRRYIGGVCCETYDQILRKDTGVSEWQEETEQLHGIYLDSILMLPGGQEGWAGGAKTIEDCKFTCSESYLLHYTNGSWVTDNTPNMTGRSVVSIAFAEGVGYAVGEAVMTYNGQKWAQVDLPQLPPGPTVPPNKEACPGLYFACLSFYKVQVVSPDEFWVLGQRYSTLSDSELVFLHMAGGRWNIVMPGSAILQDRPSGTLPLSVSDFSVGSDGFGFLATSPIRIPGDKAYPQIIKVWPDGSLSYERIPQLEQTALFSVSNTDANHALALGLQSTFVATERNVDRSDSAVLLSYGYDEGGPQTPAPTPSPIYLLP